MAVDPAMVGFNVVDNLQNTLLSYVMQNRQMEQQDRQFNAELGQREQEFKRTFEEGQKRYNLGRGDLLDQRKADKLMGQQIMSRNKQKQLREEFDKNRTAYIENMKNISLGTGGLFSGDYWKSKFSPSQEQYYGQKFDTITGSRPTIGSLQMPNTSQLPSIGLDAMLAGEPSKQSLLNMLMLQGG